jgi:hypothetical protein
MLKKIIRSFLCILIIFSLLIFIVLYVLEDESLLLCQRVLTTADEITLHDAFEFIFSKAEEKGNIVPCHFYMDFDSNTSVATFSLFFFRSITADLFYVCKYDYTANGITETSYIGYSENLKDLCSNLCLGFNLDFRANATVLFNKALFEINAENEMHLCFPIGYGYFGGFDSSHGWCEETVESRPVSQQILFSDLEDDADDGR